MNNIYCISEEFENEIIDDDSWMDEEPEEEPGEEIGDDDLWFLN